MEIKLIPSVAVHGRPCCIDVIGYIGLLEREIGSDVIVRIGTIAAVVDFVEFVTGSHRYFDVGRVAVATFQVPA